MFTLSHAPTLTAPCISKSPEEPEEHECAIVDPSSEVNNQDSLHGKEIIHLDMLNSELLDPECEAALETMDNCLGCVEGVDEQHNYEEKMIEHNRHRKAAVEQHGLSEAEAAMIRLHIMEEGRDDTKQVHDSAIPDLDILNLCGNDEDLDDAYETFMIPPAHEGMSCADMVDEELILANPRKDREVRDGIVIGQDINALQCAICFDEALTGGNVSLNRVKFANLPCCGSSEQNSNASIIKVCTSCILVLTSPSSKGSNRVGRCPRCLTWIKVKIPKSADDRNVVKVDKVDVSGQCLICNQTKDFLVDNDNVCDSCFLGRRQPLRYECQQCHEIQKIPHPMYRYQKTKDQFGNVTWACQGKCGRFTNWKIQPDELHRIPLGDAPKSWGHDYIKLARDRVQILRQDLVGEEKKNSAKLASSLDEDPSQCSIL